MGTDLLRAAEKADDVFPVMGHPVLYGIALLIGSGVTALLPGLWKKAKGDGAVQ